MFHRYFCIVHGDLVRRVGPRRAADIAVAANLAFPAFCVVALHYPMDGGFSILNLCQGR